MARRFASGPPPASGRPTLQRPDREGPRIARDSCRIGIDAATGVVRVAAYRQRDGRLLAHASAPFAIDEEGERREIDFEDVATAQAVALDAVLARLAGAIRVDGLGVAATASTVAVVSERDGRPLGPGLLWADQRATAEAAAMRRAGHPALERMLGHVSPEWGIAKLARLARQGRLAAPEGRVVELADWLAFRLTGIWVANAGTREWGWAGGDDGVVPASLLEVAGAPVTAASMVVPDVRLTGLPLGVVRPGPGVPAEAVGIPVLVGGMDSYLAAYGMGVARPGRLCITVGSSSAAVAGIACGDGAGRMFGPLRTVLPGVPEGVWQGGQTTAGLAAAWAVRVLRRPADALERDAASSPPGARGVTFRETLLDRRNPAPRAPMTGGWTGVGLEHEPADLYRAVLEGIVFGLAEACGGLAPEEVVTAGGMLRSPLFRRILADVLGRPVVRLRDAGSAAALGAAFADEPGRIVELVRIASVTEPSGADYEEARGRYLAAEPPEPPGGAHWT